MIDRIFATVVALLLLFATPGTAFAQNAIEEALKDCSAELKTYCSQVTPGDGRLVSCAQAHEDKFSEQCVSAINRATFLLDFFERTITYVGTQCASDAVKFCPDVELGEQRVLNCLQSKKAELTKYCSLALKDIGRD